MRRVEQYSYYINIRVTPIYHRHSSQLNANRKEDASFIEVRSQTHQAMNTVASRGRTHGLFGNYALDIWRNHIILRPNSPSNLFMQLFNARKQRSYKFLHIFSAVSKLSIDNRIRLSHSLVEKRKKSAKYSVSGGKTSTLCTNNNLYCLFYWPSHT